LPSADIPLRLKALTQRLTEVQDYDGSNGQTVQ
jgi:hypothetical protein